MPGPAPSPNPRRRNARPGVTVLPREGYTGPLPAWPLAIRASRAEVAAWEALWRTPQAAAWAEHHLTRTVARYVRALVKAERPAAQAFLLSEVRQLEGALGLNSMAMLRLRWEMSGDEVADRRDQRATSAAPVTLVRPVDQGAGEGGG